MYSMKDAVVRNLEFMEENLRLKADVKRFAELNDQLIEENEALKKKLDQCETLWKATAQTLQTEIDRLTKELAEERNQHSDVAASCSEDQCECNRLREENVKLKKALDSARDSMRICKEKYEGIIENLNSLLAGEQKEAEHAKLMFNIAFSYLDQTGYDVEKLGHIVALRCALEESGLV